MNFGTKANLGIKKKVLSQSKAFQNLGLDTSIQYFEDNAIVIKNSKSEGKLEFRSTVKQLYHQYFGFVTYNKLEEFDYFFVRHFFTDPLFILMLLRLKIKKASIKIFMEIPTYPYVFAFKSSKSSIKIRIIIDWVCTFFYRFFISRIITPFYKGKIYGIQSINADNGIDISNFKIQSITPFDGENLHVLALANFQVWHGLDRLIKGMADFQKNHNKINVHCHFVGGGDELSNLENLTKTNNLESKITFHGFKNGQELDDIIAKCHVAIGSCGMHRIKMENGETTPLKSREYCAKGIPFVIAYKDRGFPDDFPFFMEIPADETPIDIQKTIDFYARVSKIEDFNLSMNNYAKENFTWESKLENIVKAFQIEK
jgi:glycosyltransferase involved in cell wall biosynthesis